MKTKIQIAVAVVLIAVCSGCKTPNLARNVARATTSGAVILAASKDPKIVPYFRIATPIFCQAANGTNVYSPDQIVEALKNPDVDRLKTLAAVVVVNSILSFYSAAYEEDPNNSAKSAIEGICLGLEDSMLFFQPMTVPSAGGSPIPRPAMRQLKLPPHID